AHKLMLDVECDTSRRTRDHPSRYEMRCLPCKTARKPVSKPRQRNGRHGRPAQGVILIELLCDRLLGGDGSRPHGPELEPDLIGDALCLMPGPFFFSELPPQSGS